MNAEQLLQHFNRISEAPDAITRLRRFILDLAVRGKLVEQDPSDEPAAELLKQIAAEKARLGSKHTVLSVDEEEAPFELPSGWSWSRIGEICSKTGSGSTPRGGKEVYKQSGTIFLRSQNVYNDGLRLNDVVYIDKATHERMSGTRVHPGDLLLNITGGSMGRCCLVPNDAEDANVSQHVAIIRSALRGSERFLHKLVLSPYFQAFVFAEQTGAGRGGLPKNRMDKIAVALPPLAEQHRIVAMVDELMSLCDQLEAAKAEREQCRDSLVAASLQGLSQPAEEEETFREHAQFTLNIMTLITKRTTHIKQLRQTILDLAVRGKLVEQDPSDEPAAELLKRIAAEKARLVKAGRGSNKNTPSPLSNNDQPYSLPSKWEWVRLGSISTSIQYGYTASADMAISVPRFVRITDIHNGRVDWDSVPGCEIEADKLPTYKLEENDFLVARTGGTIGKSFLVANVEHDSVFASYLIRIRVFPQFIYPQFLKYYLESPLYWGQLHAASMGTGQPNVNGKSLGLLKTPVPPLAEQHRIVARVDELMSLCDQLEAQITETEQDSRRYLEAVLHEALALAMAEAA